MFESATEQQRLIRAREISPVEAVQAALDRIEAVNPALNAFVQLDAEVALRVARAQTEAIARGEEVGPLAGLALGVKDLESALGFRTTSGSRVFADRVAEQDEVHVARLRAAGAIVVGKTNTPEFGYTAFTSNELFGTTRNPWDLTKTPGGSSGGSAAAIASGMVPLVTASDGGGSVRIPASFVGAYGLKPTFGVVPVTPGRMLGWTDTGHHGALTRSVEDAALYLDVVAGYSAVDPNSTPRVAYSYVEALSQPLAPLRIAYGRTFGLPTIAPDILRALDETAKRFEALGHHVEALEDWPEPTAQHWMTMSIFQAIASMAELIETPGALSPRYASMLQMGKAIGAPQFREAYVARARLNEWLRRLFERYDLLLTPTMPLEPFAAEGPIPVVSPDDPFGGWIITFTAPFNLSGHPAATFRAGFTDSALPVGAQLVGERHRDDLVLRASHAHETEYPWDKWPEL